MLAIYAILQYIGQRGVTVYFCKGVWRYLKEDKLRVPTLFLFI